MTEYINMWKNYTNFSGRTDRRGFWMAILFNFLALMILGVIDNALGFGGFNYQFSPYASASGSGPLVGLYSLAAFVPELAIMVRRLRDAGRSWKNMFFFFLPIAGIIILIVKWCKPSIELPEETA